jgi:hypothetical protein
LSALLAKTLRPQALCVLLSLTGVRPRSVKVRPSPWILVQTLAQNFARRDAFYVRVLFQLGDPAVAFPIFQEGA